MEGKEINESIKEGSVGGKVVLQLKRTTRGWESNGKRTEGSETGYDASHADQKRGRVPIALSGPVQRKKNSREGRSSSFSTSPVP